MVLNQNSPSEEYGYFIQENKKNINKVIKFIEKPPDKKAKKIIKKKDIGIQECFLQKKFQL